MEIKMKKSILEKSWMVFIVAILCTALWGGAFPGIKIGYQVFHISSQATGSQIMFAGIRFFLAGCLAWVIGSISFRKPLVPKKGSFPYILILAILQTYLQYFFFYVGLAHTTGVKASIIEAMNVFVALLIAALLFRQEQLTGKKIIGCIIGFVGVVLVNLSGSGVAFDFTIAGEGAIFLSTVAYAFSSVCIKRFSKYEEPFVLSAYQFMLGGVLLFLTGLIWNINAGVKEEEMLVMAKTLFTSSGMGIVMLLAGISAVAYSLWGQLLKYNEVSKVTIFGFLTPVFGVVFSAIFLAEQTASSPIVVIISLALVSFGIILQD
ncbi:MAG: DMT family transporter [Lachnospiraceae bacterium]|nr:DMT family transporter [Lachnospiraceae bacterium]